MSPSPPCGHGGVVAASRRGSGPSRHRPRPWRSGSGFTASAAFASAPGRWPSRRGGLALARLRAALQPVMAVNCQPARRRGLPQRAPERRASDRTPGDRAMAMAKVTRNAEAVRPPRFRHTLGAEPDRQRHHGTHRTHPRPAPHPQRRALSGDRAAPAGRPGMLACDGLPRPGLPARLPDGAGDRQRRGRIPLRPQRRQALRTARPVAEFGRTARAAGRAAAAAAQRRRRAVERAGAAAAAHREAAGRTRRRPPPAGGARARGPAPHAQARRNRVPHRRHRGARSQAARASNTAPAPPTNARAAPCRRSA